MIKKNWLTIRVENSIHFFTKLAIVSGIIFSVSLQVRSQENIPEGYFQFPFNPGKTNFLSGNMGELRTNHFHGGLDVKTAAQVGLPILAAADGYVSKIRVSSYGYGNVVYITHPNNFVTVYAHLDRFNKEITDLVKSKQYEKQTFEIDVYPEINQLIVKKGDQIGVSGNTGSSGGPHLHFEIRDKNDRLYNPLMFGFPEIKDNIAPLFDKIVLKTFDQQSRVNNEFGRFEFTPLKQGKRYSIPASIMAVGNIGIEVKVYDKMAFTQNSYGVTCIEVKVDGKETFYHNLKSLPFEDNKYINAHIDYENFIRKGRRFERCYISDGNKLSTYKQNGSTGKLNINDTLTHQVEINIYDAHNNMSTLNFRLKGAAVKNTPVPQFIPSTKLSSTIATELFENILKIQGKYTPGSPVQLFKKGEGYVISPDYFKNNQAVFLYDMRKGLPDSVRISGEVKKLNYSEMIPSGKDYTYKNNGFNIRFPKDCLFDTLYLQYKNGLAPDRSEVYQVNDLSVPLFKSPQVSIVPSQLYTEKERTFIYNVTRWPLFEGGVWKEDGAICFNPKNLGRFSYLYDAAPPVIKFINKIGNSARFNIFDRNSGISSFNATLDGKWVLMNYDHKRKLIWSSLSSSEEKLKGEFVLEVTDNSGNKTTFRRNFL